VQLNGEANRVFVKFRKSTVAAPSCGLLNAKFLFKGTSPTNHFCMDSYANKCLTSLSLTVFTQRNFVAEFLQANCYFTWKRPFCGFERTLGP